MTLNDVTISYGNKKVYENFSITFKDLSITAILGASGCGKTTLLNEIASRNSLHQISFIFQEPRLIPWETIEKNIMFALKSTAPDRIPLIPYYLELVGLHKRAGSYPGSLSGGEKQRVAIARAFSSPSPILLMDEPFQSQDPATKNQLIDLIKKLHRQEKKTIIAVTHDISDAAKLADQAFVLGNRPVEVLLDTVVDADFEKKCSEVLSWQTSLIN